MIKHLIIITALMGTAQAKPFSMSDYLAQTGKLPTKQPVKATGYVERADTTAKSIERLEGRKEGLAERKTLVNKQYAEQMAKIAKLSGDTSPSRQSAMMDRKTRLFTIDSEIKKIDIRIEELKRMLEYYNHMVKADEMAKKLRAEKLISFSC